MKTAFFVIVGMTLIFSLFGAMSIAKSFDRYQAAQAARLSY